MRIPAAWLAVLAAGCATAPAAGGPAPEERPERGPWISEIQPRKPGPGSKIRLVGHRLAREGAQTWIRLPRDLWIEAESASETEIVLKLPSALDSGSVQVQVGGELGNARPLVLVRAFSTPVPPEAVVPDEKGRLITTTSDLAVSLLDFQGLDEAEAIAMKHGGKVTGYLPGVNLFELRFKTRTIDDLTAVQKSLEKEPGVERVVPMLGLRPR
jgi:hypothetical protein